MIFRPQMNTDEGNSSTSKKAMSQKATSSAISLVHIRKGRLEYGFTTSRCLEIFEIGAQKGVKQNKRHYADSAYKSSTKRFAIS